MVLKNAKEKIVKQKNAELIFANLPSIRKLKIQFFKSRQLFAHIYYACNPVFGPLAIFNMKIWKRFAFLYFLI